MGSSASKIEIDDKIRACKERIRLVKQLMEFREEFVNSQLAYLKSLKNVGATLRQLIDSHTSVFEFENSDFDNDINKSQESTSKVFDLLNLKMDTDDDDDYEDMPILPPPRIEDWDRWHSTFSVKNEASEKVNEKNNGVGETSNELRDTGFKERVRENEMGEKDSSLMSWYAKQKTKSDMGVWGERKTLTLAGVTKELDECFLKASVIGTGLAVFMDTKSLGILHLDDNKRKLSLSLSAKIFSTRRRSWPSTKSLHVSRDIVDPSDPSCPGAHCITLEKLYVEEQKLYNYLKEEERIRPELQRKTSFLLRQQEEDPEWEHLGKTILNVERLQSDVLYLEQSISGTCASILKLIDVELQCQLIVLNTGLMHMWNTMYECHQNQYQASQELSNQNSSPCLDPVSDYQCKATTQLENEVCLWYDTFTGLVKSQQDFLRTFCQWLKLANWLVDEQNQSDSLPIVYKLCEDWLLALDSLPDKIVAEALKGFLAAIQSIVLQQVDEQAQKMKSDKVNKRLDKELYALSEIEAKHPLSVRHARSVEALRKEADYEKTKYENLVKLSNSMMLNRLRTSLPSVFLALMEYSRACTQRLEALYDNCDTCSSNGIIIH